MMQVSNDDRSSFVSVLENRESEGIDRLAALGLQLGEWVSTSPSLQPERVTLDFRAHPSAALRHFVGDNRPEISLDQTRTHLLIRHVQAGNVTTSLLSDPEVPYLALAAFVNHPQAFSLTDLCTLLIMHQLHQDYGDQVKIGHLLDVEGNWTPEAREHAVVFHRSRSPLFHVRQVVVADVIESTRLAIQKLPRFQQMFYYGLPGTSLDCDGLALETESAYLEILNGSRFGLDLRLGLISATEVIDAEVQRWARPCHIPFPGVTTPLSVHGKRQNRTVVARHDRVHREIALLYRPLFLEAIFELITSFRDFTGEKISRETWAIGDLIFPQLLNFYDPQQTCSEQFDILIGSTSTDDFAFSDLFGTDPDMSLFGWNTAMHILANREKWRKRFGIHLSKINVLAKMCLMMKRAAAYLNERPKLEKIFYLQLLNYTEQTTALKIKSFFENQPLKCSQFAIEKIKEPGPARNCLRITVIEVPPVLKASRKRSREVLPADGVME